MSKHVLQALSPLSAAIEQYGNTDHLGDSSGDSESDHKGGIGESDRDMGTAADPGAPRAFQVRICLSPCAAR